MSLKKINFGNNVIAKFCIRQNSFNKSMIVDYHTQGLYISQYMSTNKIQKISYPKRVTAFEKIGPSLTASQYLTPQSWLR